MNDLIYTEKGICDLFGITQKELTRFRLREGLPYLRLSRRARAYLWSDIFKFVTAKRVIHSKNALKYS